ncbi:MAG: hypothetical protein OZ948_07860 [Deltaproteobacteria bacterium]|nr:hypothetical protein [Deltaproteobacteria bacterium]
MNARTRISTFAAAATLLCSLAVAGAAFAQARVHEKVNIAVTGDITALDPAARTITVKSTHDDGIEYTVDGSATIMRGSQTLELADLKEGWNVVVNGHQTGDTRLLTMIKVVKAP